MNRDLRIGLSLSLLALGAAGAFCFRADPAAVDPAPPAVAETSAAEPAPAVLPPPPPVRLGPPPPPVAAVASPLPVQTAPAIATAPEFPRLATLALTVPPAAFDSPAPASAPLRDSDGLTRTPDQTPTATSRTHTVVSGDTLSGIAEQTLGSHRRYLEIYEANRDLLKHPDALRVGMTLRIPGPAAR